MRDLGDLRNLPRESIERAISKIADGGEARARIWDVWYTIRCIKDGHGTPFYIVRRGDVEVTRGSKAHVAMALRSYVSPHHG